MKQPLIEVLEPSKSQLRLVESDPKRLPQGVLAVFEGPIGTTEEETENGRAYGNRLWKKVIESERVRDLIGSKGLLGEADHPEGLETSIPRVSHAISKMWLDEAHNTLYGRIDVLDTPSGRIVKTLADYGWKPGISSRGLGEVVSSAGRREIDPDTYEYITHDLVVDPACRRAHLSVVESRGGRVPLREALVRLAEKDHDEYAKEAEFYRTLFLEKFGIDLSKLDSEERTGAAVPEPSTPGDSVSVDFFKGRIYELGETVVRLNRTLNEEREARAHAPASAAGAAQGATGAAVDESVKELFNSYVSLRESAEAADARARDNKKKRFVAEARARDLERKLRTTEAALEGVRADLKREASAHSSELERARRQRDDARKSLREAAERVKAVESELARANALVRTAEAKVLSQEKLLKERSERPAAPARPKPDAGDGTTGPGKTEAAAKQESTGKKTPRQAGVAASVEDMADLRGRAGLQERSSSDFEKIAARTAAVVERSARAGVRKD